MLRPMFGTYRYLLAHLVAFGHLWRPFPLMPGSFAVYSFYMLSGYLMALVLARTYGYEPRGVSRYLANRALRIYPPYLAACFLALIVLSFAADEARSVSTMRMPTSWSLLLQNLAIFGLHLNRLGSQLIPPAWSIDIELWFYILMGLGLGKSRRIAGVWFAASALYTVYMVAADYPFNARYSRIVAASLPYSAGALLFHLRTSFPSWLKGGWHVPASILLYLGVVLSSAFVWVRPHVGAFYTAQGVTAYAIVAGSGLGKRNAPRWFARMDDFLGGLSYPVFLCNWCVGVTVLWLGWAEGSGARLFWISLPFVNLTAWLIHVGVEEQVDRLRDRLRGVERGATRSASS